MPKVKPGDVLVCEVCGLSVIVDEECGYALAEIICCDEIMENKGPKPAKKVAPATKKKAAATKAKPAVAKKEAAKKAVAKKAASTKEAAKKTAKKKTSSK